MTKTKTCEHDNCPPSACLAPSRMGFGNHVLLVFGPSAHPGGRDATPADIIACLRANPVEGAEVLAHLAALRSTDLARLASAEAVVEKAQACWREALQGIPCGPHWAALGQALDAHDAAKAGDSGGAHAKIARNMKTDAGREFWAATKAIAAQAQDWPDSRKAGINVSHEATWRCPNCGGDKRYAGTRRGCRCKPPADSAPATIGDSEQVDEWTRRVAVPGGWLYRWETPAYNGCPGGVAQTFVPADLLRKGER